MTANITDQLELVTGHTSFNRLTNINSLTSLTSLTNLTNLTNLTSLTYQSESGTTKIYWAISWATFLFISIILCVVCAYIRLFAKFVDSLKWFEKTVNLICVLLAFSDLGILITGPSIE